MQAGQDWLQQAGWYIKSYWTLAVIYVNRLPLALSLIIRVCFFVALFSILLSHVTAIMNEWPVWKPIPNSGLMYSYFNGTGFAQCGTIYVDIFNKSWDKKWTPLSIAGLAYRLGQIQNKSKFLLFLLSIIYIPLNIIGFVEMIFRSLIGTVYAVIMGIIHWLILLLLYLINLLLTPFWKLVDLRKTVEQHCPHCYSTFKLPAYRCPDCDEIHKDLRPGKAGLLFARCNCGSFIPSAIISGRSKLDTLCPECGRPLAASNAKEHTIILIGGNTSGKTAFLASFYKTYTVVAKNTNRVDIGVQPTTEFLELDMIYDSGTTIPSSSTSIRAYNFVHDFPGRQETIVIYDVPDEVLLEEEYFEKNPLNFAYSDGFVIIFDPFTERSVRVESQKLGEDVMPDSYSSDTLEDIVVAFVQQFSKIASRSSNKISRTPVAVVINKTDMKAVRQKVGDNAIRKVYRSDPERFNNDISVARNDVCRNYLVKLGLSNAINNLESVFSNVQYFAASSMGHVENGKPFMPEHVLDPFVWLADQGSVGQSVSLLKRVCETVNGVSSDDVSDLEKKYKKASLLLAEQDYEAAEHEFRDIEDYKDSATIIANIPELRYQNAKQRLSEGDFCAVKEFIALNNYKDSKACAREGMFSYAEYCMENGKYQKALSAYQSVGTYKGSDQKAQEARYLVAKQEVASGEITAALDNFVKLGDYKDAKAQIRAMAPMLIRAGVTREISFGPTEWRVMFKDDRGMALLISEDVVFLAPFHTEQAPVTWADSGLRNYLNGKFLNFFSNDEKKMIFPTKISTPNNDQYGTPGGDDSFDSVFILSVDEAKQLFTDKMERLPSNIGNNFWYWLRTPGGSPQHASIIESTGAVNEGGNSVSNKNGGVRPVIWVAF